MNHWAGSIGQVPELGQGSGPALIASPSSTFDGFVVHYLGGSPISNRALSISGKHVPYVGPVEKTLASTGQHSVRLKPWPVHTTRTCSFFPPSPSAAKRLFRHPSLRPGRLSRVGLLLRLTTPARELCSVRGEGLKPRGRRFEVLDLSTMFPLP